MKLNFFEGSLKKISSFLNSYRPLTVILFFIVLFLVSCGQDKQENKESTPPLNTEIPKPQSPSNKETLPVSQKTRNTYQFYCAQCHGVKGKGNGINAPFLTVPPRDHTKASYLETRTDEQLFTAIKHGGLSVGRAPCMPSWGNTLDDTVIQSLVRYIRELCKCEAL